MKLNYALDRINHLFQMLSKNRDQPYGNKVLLLEIKWKSFNLPSKPWPLFRQLQLVQNMRTAACSQEYADWLIQLGNGSLPSIPTPNDPELIQISLKIFWNFQLIWLTTSLVIHRKSWTQKWQRQFLQELSFARKILIVSAVEAD
jgi:hypothetical protein